MKLGKYLKKIVKFPNSIKYSCKHLNDNYNKNFTKRIKNLKQEQYKSNSSRFSRILI